MYEQQQEQKFVSVPWDDDQETPLEAIGRLNGEVIDEAARRQSGENTLELIAQILRRPEWPSGADALDWIAEILRGGGIDLQNGLTDEGDWVVDGQIRHSYLVTLSTMIRVDADAEDDAGRVASDELHRHHASRFEWNIEDVQEDSDR